MKALSIIFLGLWSIAALAQGTDPAAPPAAPGSHLTPEQHMANLAVLLELTDEQKPKFEAVLQQEHAKMQRLFDQAHAAGTRPSFGQMEPSTSRSSRTQSRDSRRCSAQRSSTSSGFCCRSERRWARILPEGRMAARTAGITKTARYRNSLRGR